MVTHSAKLGKWVLGSPFSQTMALGKDFFKKNFAKCHDQDTWQRIFLKKIKKLCRVSPSQHSAKKF
jgi:hypothetical protein